MDIDDDGNVAYAFFLVDETITGRVRLYNHPNFAPNPWDAPTDREKPPTNIESYYTDEPFQPIQDESEVQLIWNVRDGYREATIYIRRLLHAVVADELDPGWCRIATQDSIVARAFARTKL